MSNHAINPPIPSVQETEDCTQDTDNIQQDPETDTSLNDIDPNITEHAETQMDEPTEGETAIPHYEVNVTQYAHYAPHDEVYNDDTKKSLSYAARTPFSRFFLDFGAILIRPSAFWEGQALHPATMGQLYCPHLIILILLRTAAVGTGGMLQPHADPVQVLIQAIVQGLLIFILIWGMALIVATITACSGVGFHYRKALRFVGYSITPLIFVGIVGIIPLHYLANICDFLAMPWAFVVMGAGILPYFKLKPEKAPIVTALLCGILLCLWGALPMLIPFLMG